MATGFRKWGLAMGIAAAELLAAWVDGATTRGASCSTRAACGCAASAGSLLKENANVALRFFGDRIVKRADVDSIERGEGRIVGAGLGQRAVYRDEHGELHALSARCTHLGLHRQLELRRGHVGLPLPRVALRAARRGDHGAGGARAGAARAAGLAAG